MPATGSLKILLSPPLIDILLSDSSSTLLTLLERIGAWTVHVLNVLWTFLIHTLPTRLSTLLQHLFQISPQHFLTFLLGFHTFLQSHLALSHLFAWSIFIGPILLLLPLLILNQTILWLLFNASLLSHGFLIKETLTTHYASLHTRLSTTKEPLSYTIEAKAATYNQWTMDFFPLFVLRVAAGAVGVWLSWGIWREWEG